MNREQIDTSPLHGPGIKQQLQGWIALTKSRLLCNAIVNLEIRILHSIFSKIRVNIFKSDESLSSTVLATLFLAGFLYALTILIGKAWDHSIPVWNPAALCVSLLTAFSLSLVKRLHDNILPKDRNNFASEIIIDVNGEDKAFESLRDWWQSFLRRRNQILFVVIVGLLAIAMLFWLRGPMAIHLGSYFLIFCLGIAIGQGGYCAMIIPRLASVLRKTPMRLFWLSPADSPWVRDASSLFTKLSLANAFIGTCFMFGILWLRPWQSITTAGIAALCLLCTWVVVLYSFIYPHFQLGKALKLEKSERMRELQDVIDQQRASFIQGNASEEEAKKFVEMIKVYEQLASARSTAIDTQAIVRLSLSLAMPMLSFLAVLVNLGKLFSDFMKAPGPP